MAKAIKLGFLTNKFTSHEVSPGYSLDFYPIRLGTYINDIRTLAVPVVKALTFFFGDDALIHGSKETVNTVDDSNEYTRISEVDPVDATLWKQVQDQKAEHISTAIDTLASDETRLLIAKIILDSLRCNPTDFVDEKGERLCSDLESFCSNVLTLNMLSPMLAGVGKANAEIFGPLQKMLNLSNLTTSLEAKLGQVKENPEKAEPESIH